jgi:hypothetical protein
MIFTVNSGHLRRAIKLAESIVDLRDPLPALRSVRLCLDEDKNVILHATDSYTFVRVVIPDAKVEKTEPATQHGHCFNIEELLGNLPIGDDVAVEFNIHGVNPSFCDGANAVPARKNPWRCGIVSGENHPRFFPRNPMGGTLEFDPDEMREDMASSAKLLWGTRRGTPSWRVAIGPSGAIAANVSRPVGFAFRSHRSWKGSLSSEHREYAACPASLAGVLCRDDIRLDGVAHFGEEAYAHRVKFASFPFIFDGHMSGVVEVMVGDVPSLHPAITKSNRSDGHKVLIRHSDVTSALLHFAESVGLDGRVCISCGSDEVVFSSLNGKLPIAIPTLSVRSMDTNDSTDRLHSAMYDIVSLRTVLECVGPDGDGNVEFYIRSLSIGPPACPSPAATEIRGNVHRTAWIQPASIHVQENQIAP